MKAKKNNMLDSVNQSDSEISVSILAKLEKRVLFPEKIEETKKFFSQLIFSTL